MTDGRFDVWLAYVLGRRWALVPLHDVSTGACTCGEDCGGNAGKHPRSGAQWQRPDNLVLDETALTSALKRWPAANFGLATGLVSGVWAVDWDPKNADPAQAAEVGAVLAALSASGTWTQRTGSGGQHWVFALPADFVPNNSRKRLPRGFDVRGGTESSGGMSGGQIVLAPSTSGKGPYEVLLDGPVRDAPEVIAEMVRPVVHRPAPGIPQAPVGRERAWAYIQPILIEMATAPEGDRDNTAIRTAMRLQALAHGGAFAADEVWPAWYAAAMQHPFKHASLERKWAYADRNAKVEYIPDAYDSPFGGTPILPFAVPGAEPNSDGSAPGDETVVVPPGPMGLDGTSGPQPVDNPVDRWEFEVQRQVLQLSARREAQRRLDAAAVGDREPAVVALLSSLVDTAGLDDVPALAPLIDGFLYRDSFARIIGASGSGKTFVALDMAAAVATGRSWCGRAVSQGPVVYMVAEGFSGIRRRVRAWEQEHGTKMSGVWFLGVPMQATGTEWDTFVEACRRLGPVMIVIDTQARATVGVDENSATEMGVVVDAAERLRAATGACTVFVHHKGLDGTHGRGSTAVKAALQTELSVERKQGLVTLSTVKQKDDAEAEPVAFRLSPVELDGTDETAAILRPLDVAPRAYALSDAELAGQLGDVAGVAAEVFAGAAGGTKAEFRSVVMTERKVVTAKSTFYRLWSQMIARKIIGKIHGSQAWRYIPPEDRDELIEPLPGNDPDRGGYYAP